MARAILSQNQIDDLRSVLADRLLVVSFGAGVDSTAMLVALHEAGLKPAAILFADTGNEKPDTYRHVERINDALAAWHWPRVEVCRRLPRENTGYVDLRGNCLKNETLPSLAYGRKSCSLKWKATPMDQHLMGVASGPNAKAPHPAWMEAQLRGQRIVRLIGYDCGVADVRRSASLKTHEETWDFAYPLQIVGWSRPHCVRAIEAGMGRGLVPTKSSCAFCPATKKWELFWLAAQYPELLEQALEIERVAMTGKHSRVEEEFGRSWIEIVALEDSFPSSTKTVGLGRSFSWTQWARINEVTDEHGSVRRGHEDRARFAALSNALRDPDNALDSRSQLAALEPLGLFG